MTKYKVNPLKPPTVKDVANLAGVSSMTISNYLNGNSQRMSESVRVKVEQAIEQLNYRRNHSARNLRISKQLSIGMIIVDNSPAYLTDGYTNQIVAGVSNYLSTIGFSLVLQGITPKNFKDSTLIKNLQSDGIITMLSGDESERRKQFNILKRLNLPLLIFLESFSAPGDNACFVKQDEISAGQKVAEHVLSNKLESALILVQKHNNWAAVTERVRGMRTVLETRLKLDQIAELDCGDGSFDVVQNALAQHIQHRGIPQAILSTNDQMAIAAIKYLQAQEVDIPKTVKVTGFNAFELHRYSSPELTTIRSPAYDMGAEGARLIVNKIVTGKYEKKEAVFPFEFICGNSS
jgi:LacI family transcriptional regulator